MTDRISCCREMPLGRALAISILFALSCPLRAFGLDFKGVELGNTLWASQERAVFGELDCNPFDFAPGEYQGYVLDLQTAVPGARRVCVATTSIATVPAEVTIILGPARRVMRLTFQFDGQEYDRVVEAMKAKWGEGLVDSRDEFDESVWWDFEDGSSVSVHQTPGDAGSGVIDVDNLVGLAEYSLAVATPAGDL